MSASNFLSDLERLEKDLLILKILLKHPKKVYTREELQKEFFSDTDKKIKIDVQQRILYREIQRLREGEIIIKASSTPLLFSLNPIYEDDITKCTNSTLNILEKLKLHEASEKLKKLDKFRKGVKNAV